MRVLPALLAVGVLAGCSSSDAPDLGDPSSTTTSSVPGGEVEADPGLEPRTIAVDGEPEVGATLTVRVSSDLDRSIGEWSWQRCSDVPACLTITDADGPTYVPTVTDAWQVLRVIAVADGRAVVTNVGPVTNPHPAPFRERLIADPSVGGGVALIVGPGVTRVVVQAECPVVAVAGVATPTIEGSQVTDEVGDDDPAGHHELTLDSGGGQLTVGIRGECDRATVTVAGRR